MQAIPSGHPMESSWCSQPSSRRIHHKEASRSSTLPHRVACGSTPVSIFNLSSSLFLASLAAHACIGLRSCVWTKLRARGDHYWGCSCAIRPSSPDPLPRTHPLAPHPPHRSAPQRLRSHPHRRRANSRPAPCSRTTRAAGPATGLDEHLARPRCARRPRHS